MFVLATSLASMGAGRGAIGRQSKKGMCPSAFNELRNMVGQYVWWAKQPRPQPRDGPAQQPSRAGQGGMCAASSVQELPVTFAPLAEPALAELRKLNAAVFPIAYNVRRGSSCRARAGPEGRGSLRV
jgi:hypothetical protein